MICAYCIRNKVDFHTRTLDKRPNSVFLANMIITTFMPLPPFFKPEKEWVSALIHAELAEMNFLALHQKGTSAEPAAETRKPSKVKSPPNSPTEPKVLTRSRKEHQLTR